MSNLFTNTTPEKVGIPSEAVLRFLNRLDSLPVDMHSVILSVGEKIFCEEYFAPFTKDTLHRMFSVTKSVVSLAIGRLCENGMISLDDRIVDYFPEYTSVHTPHPYLAMTTIRHMLTMNTPHAGTTYNKHILNDWSESYFTVVPSHRPGTVFSYDTSSSQVLCALVEKLTNKSLLDFLRDEYLSELGFSKSAYCLTDGSGVSIGGSGLMALPRDLLILSYLLLNNGVINGKSYYSGYIGEATKKQTETFVKGGFKEEMQGYGYQIWRTTHNGFAMYGMGGQLGVIIPEHNFIMVTTADTIGIGGGVQMIYDCLWEEIYPYLGNNAVLEVREHMPDFSGRIIPLSPGTIDISCSHRYKMLDNTMKISALSLETDFGQGMLTLVNESGTLKLPFGLKEPMYTEFPNYNVPMLASGKWLDEKTLAIVFALIGEEVGKVQIQLSLDSDNVTLFAKKNIETKFTEFSGYAEGTAI